MRIIEWFLHGEMIQRVEDFFVQELSGRDDGAINLSTRASCLRWQDTRRARQNFNGLTAFAGLA
jgi:hypothetical protein